MWLSFCEIMIKGGRCHTKRLCELLNCTKSKNLLFLKINSFAQEFYENETFRSKIEKLSYQIFKVNGAIIIQQESSLDTTQTFSLDFVSSKSTGKKTLICLSLDFRGSKSFKKPQ